MNGAAEQYENLKHAGLQLGPDECRTVTGQIIKIVDRALLPMEKAGHMITASGSLYQREASGQLRSLKPKVASKKARAKMRKAATSR